MVQSLFRSVLEISLSTSLLLIVLLPLLPVLRKHYSVKWRYWLWLILALRLLIPFNPTLPNAPITIQTPVQDVAYNLTTSNTATPPTAGNMPTAAAALPVSPALTLMDIICIVWLSGIVLFMLYHLLGYYRFKRMVRRFSNPIHDSKILALWDEIKDDFKLRQDIRFLVCKNIGSPMMTGFFKPVLLLPEAYYEKSELTIILRHELIHFKRGDIWYKLLLTCVNAVHWFNPLIYCMTAISFRDIEMSCDSEMVKNADAAFRKTYVETILSAVHKGNQRQMTFSTYLYGGKKTMKARFTNIFDTKKKHRGIAVLSALLVMTFTAGGLVACSAAGASSAAQSSSTISSSTSSASTSSADTSSAAFTINGKPFAESSSSKAVSNSTKSAAPAVSGVVYKNTQYGFTFSLPDSWKGYTIVSGQWQGTQNNQAVTGPEIIIRNPKWTATNKYQDIPIMVFTADQWSKVVKGPSEGPGENLYIGAAPIGPTELGHNAKYAFALPARYDFTGDTGVEEVHDIISKNPLQPIG